MARNSTATKSAGERKDLAGILLLGTVFFSPFVIWNSLFEPHHLPKQVYISLGVGLSLMAMLWQTRRQPGLSIELPRGVAVLLGLGLLWCWFSVAWSLNRYGAFVLALHWSLCALSMVPFSRLFASKLGKITFLTTVSVSGVLLSGIGLFQHIGEVDLLNDKSPISATFNLPNVAAQFLVCCVPSLLWLIVYGRNARIAVPSAAGLGAVLAHLFHIQAEAAWIAVICECLLFSVFAGLFHLRGRKPVMPRRRALGAFAALASSFLALAGASNEGWRWPGGDSVEGLQSKWTDVTTTLSPAEPGQEKAQLSGSAAYRISGYRSALKMGQQNPVLGVGLTNFEVHHPATAASLGLPTYVSLEATYETTHNDYLQVLAELGILGALILLGLLVLIGKRSLRLCRAGGRSLTPQDASFGLVAICTLAGYMVDGLFSYPSYRPVPPLLAVGFVTLLFNTAQGLPTPTLTLIPSGRWRWASTALILFLAVFGTMRIAGDYHFARQSEAAREKKIADSLDHGAKSRRWNPYFPYSGLLTGIVLMASDRLEESRPLLEQFDRDFPNKPTGLFYLAQHHLRTGQIGEARRLLTRARQIAPTDPHIRRLHQEANQLIRPQRR